jgi:signal transduction histidine kinase
VNVSRKLASGDFTARSRFAGGHGELDMLGRAFDDMATSLERREAEREEVEASQRRASAAEERDRFKTFLLSTVSHELRTPIAVIKGYASTLAEYSDRLDDAEKAEYWEAIISHSDRLDSLVSDLLLISNAESGRLPLSVGAIEVAPLVEEVVKSFQQLNGDRKFVFESKTASLEADRSRLRQVLDNLIGNAIKYSPQQSPIEVRAWETDGEVSVCVRDYGPGLPEETLEGIFEPFSRGQNAQQHSVQGYGLGLAICRAIVQAHHGRIWASLPEGGGLAVTFALPAVDSS